MPRPNRRRITARERATILVALRHLQETAEQHSFSWYDSWPEFFDAPPPHRITPMSSAEIDDLCEIIDCYPVTLDLGHA